MSDPQEPPQDAPEWFKQFTKNIDTLLGDHGARMKALEEKNAPQPQPQPEQGTKGEAENDGNDDTSGDKPKPKRKHWLLG